MMPARAFLKQCADRAERHLIGRADRRDTRLVRLWRDSSAAAAVEFALCAPILVMLSLGTVEVGRAMLTYHDLSLAAFEAGRYAMVHGTGSATPATKAQLKTVASARLIGADPAKLGIDVTWDPNNNPGSFVTIALSYPFDFMVGFVPYLTLRSDVTVIIAN
jgi:Flp pilus assembly protein TadG